MTRKDTLRRCGRIWESNETYYDNDWHTTVDERFHVSTWKFGSIHQSKVFIDYKHLMEGKHTDSIKCDGSVGVCLRPGKTMVEAMQIGLDWIEKFKQNGPASVEEVFKDSWEHWPTLFPNGNRIAVIDHILFVIGGGYGWVDGAVMCLSPDDYLESRRRDEEDKERQEMRKAVKEARELLKKYKLDKGEEPEDDWEDVRAKYWETGIYSFYPVSKNYSNICLVPDDVKPEWLTLSYEAALLLRDKSGVPDIKSKWFTKSEDDHKRQEENRKLGAELVAELERRFPHVAQKSQQISA
jgi:hypothetical protein